MVDDWKKKLSEATGRPLPKDEGLHKKKSYPSSKMPEKQGEDMPNWCLPLYDSLKRTGTTPRTMEPSANTGLLFDKFCDVWSGPEKWKPESPQKGKSVKQQFLDKIVKQLKNNKKTEELLEQYHLRRKALIKSLSGKSRDYKTAWRFVSGLGMGHVLETGFVWHKILGVPYLPGSSVKGMIRAWAVQWDDETKEEVNRLFGDSKDIGAGSLIVFDAIPLEKPGLEVDIMNPHYGDYYSKKKMKVTLAGRVQEIDTPPADYLSPNPIFFLTVASGISFKFALAVRRGKGTNDDLIKGFELLEEALENIGAGSKTAVGYGHFTK